MYFYVIFYFELGLRYKLRQFSYETLKSPDPCKSLDQGLLMITIFYPVLIYLLINSHFPDVPSK